MITINFEEDEIKGILAQITMLMEKAGAPEEAVAPFKRYLDDAVHEVDIRGVDEVSNRLTRAAIIGLTKMIMATSEIAPC